MAVDLDELDRLQADADASARSLDSVGTAFDLRTIDEWFAQNGPALAAEIRALRAQVEALRSGHAIKESDAAHYESQWKSECERLRAQVAADEKRLAWCVLRMWGIHSAPPERSRSELDAAMAEGKPC